MSQPWLDNETAAQLGTGAPLADARRTRCPDLVVRCPATDTGQLRRSRTGRVGGPFGLASQRRTGDCRRTSRTAQHIAAAHDRRTILGIGKGVSMAKSLDENDITVVRQSGVPSSFGAGAAGTVKPLGADNDDFFYSDDDNDNYDGY